MLSLELSSWLPSLFGATRTQPVNPREPCSLPSARSEMGPWTLTSCTGGGPLRAGDSKTSTPLAGGWEEPVRDLDFLGPLISDGLGPKSHTGCCSRDLAPLQGKGLCWSVLASSHFCFSLFSFLLSLHSLPLPLLPSQKLSVHSHFLWLLSLSPDLMRTIWGKEAGGEGGG